PMLSTLLVFSSIFSVQFNLEQSYVESERQNVNLTMTRELGSIAHKVTGIVGAHMAAVEGLAAYLSTQPELSDAAFNEFAAGIFARQPYMINVAAAPDLVVSRIYPLRGNEAALGLNYLEHNEQRDAVLRARDSDQPVLAGPLRLVQGGWALIGRLPVYVEGAGGERRFWGIVSATLDARKIFAAAGLSARGADHQLAVRGTDGRGAAGGVFFGSPGVFESPGVVTLPVSVASGEWLMAARVSDPAGLARGVWFLRILALVLAGGWLLALEQRQRIRNDKRYYERKLLDSEQLLQEAGRLAKVGGWKLDGKAELVHFSEQFAEMLHMPNAESASRSEVVSMLSRRHREELKNAVQRCFTHAQPFDVELPIERSTPMQWMRIIGNPVTRNGRVLEVIGAIQDVTERREFIETIQRQATRDLLTGLPNRHQFDAFLAREIAHAARNSQRVAVLFIDLDEFKSVNDNLGHGGGDELLIEAAERIRSCVRKSDIVARLSGDEFAVILPDVTNRNAASVVAAKIVASMNQPFDIRERHIFSSASVGVALYPEDGTDAETLLINADQAMYEVKKSIRNDFTFFNRELQRRSEERHGLFNKLSLAVAERRLEVFYQPIVPLDGSGQISCEALIRWRDGDSWIAPDSFIPLAEETGLITEIDRFALEEATAFSERLRASGLEPPALSVNVSPRVFFDRAGELARWVERVKLCAERADLTVEITERLLTQDTPHATVVLEQLRASGVKIAIDDFGTGYSS
ncbi:MAG: diguanylate cyclase, partial [Halioglobus sp.]|nr:diguanylate cyclase [Halioglobus sp.]